MLKNSGSIEYARRVAREFSAAARAEFDRIYGGAPGGQDVHFLRELLNYMTMREA
jgi:hypothetical protein